MNKTHLSYVLLIIWLTTVQLVSGQSEKPNIIFILTDDQAPWAFGASGDLNADTPNMDQLVNNGAYFKNAFTTTPVCSPARASIMTSRYASEYGILDFIPHPDHKLYDPTYNPGLDPESITFAEVLQEAGYATALVGKWHLGDWTQSSDKRFHPTNHGFDYFMGLTGGGTTPSNPKLELNGKLRQFSGLTTDILTDHAIKFIRKNKNKNFLLCLNTRAPHGAWLPVSEEDWAPFENKNIYIPNPAYPDLDVQKVTSEMREYLASTRGVDRNLGRIISLLKELEISERTIIMFFSDHGYNMGHNGIKHKGNGIWITKTKPEDTENISGKYRPNLYDNSLKVPAFVYWPSVVSPDVVIHNTVTTLDIYPTIVEMAGAKLPQNHLVRGRSLVPMLKGEKMEDWDDDFYGEYSMINYSNAYMRCYRTQEWKLVRDFLNPERDELYHIAFDPEENINLIHDPSPNTQRIINELHSKILQSLERANDPLLSQGIVEKEYYSRLKE